MMSMSKSQMHLMLKHTAYSTQHAHTHIQRSDPFEILNMAIFCSFFGSFFLGRLIHLKVKRKFRCLSELILPMRSERSLN